MGCGNLNWRLNSLHHSICHLASLTLQWVAWSLIVVTIVFFFYIHLQCNFNCLLFSQFAYICYFLFFSHQIINNFLTVIAVTFFTTACLFAFLYFCYLYLTSAYLQYQSKSAQHYETVDSFVSFLIVKESIQNSMGFLATAISIVS